MISVAGFVNHIINLQMPRSIPLIQTTAMALMSGCLSASAGIPMIIGKLHESGMSLQYGGHGRSDIIIRNLL